MKKKVPLTLRIPSPCSQDWSNMPAKDGGRYCGQCTKVIHDFSQMPDAELLQYFKTYPETTCGRFHKEQLNRNLQPQIRKWFLPNYLKKISAAILAALSFRTATAQGIVRSKAPVTVQPEIATKKNPVPKNITISGKLTKGNEEPLANARVGVDTLITVFTDAEGKFSIPLSGDLIASHNLYFSYENLERTVRTFHPLMGSTNYDVRLMSKQDYQSYFFTGLIKGLGEESFPSIVFPNKQLFLSSDTKAILAVVAEKLRNNPSVMIQVVAFGNSINNTKNAKRKIKLIRSFLIENLNIDKDRIFDKIDEVGSNDTIDILQYNGE